MSRLDILVLSAAYLAERTLRRLRPYMIRALTIVAGLIAITLGIAASHVLAWNPAAALLIALVAVWICQALVILTRTTRRR